MTGHRTTTQRDLGGVHQSTKKAQIKRLAADLGLPCPRCGKGMYLTVGQALAAGFPPRLRPPPRRSRIVRPLDAVDASTIDLDDFPGRIYGGVQVKLLAHRYCNRRAGAILGNRRRGAARAAEKYDRW